MGENRKVEFLKDVLSAGHTIKFRAIDSRTGKMVYGDLTNSQKITRTGLTPRLMVGGYEIIPETVGQFIGLFDCEKQEIYDGDNMV